MKLFFWGSTEVTPSTWQTIILPASFIMICQQLKQNIFWEQIKCNYWCNLILELDHYTHTARKTSNFYQEAMLSVYSLNHWWMQTEDEFFILTLVRYVRITWQDHFPQHNTITDSSGNSFPSAYCYSKPYCLTGKIV